MLNINQIKRHEGVFSSNTEAIDYVIKNTKSLYGEPLIVEYGDPDAPSVILAIGSKTNEVSGPDEIVRSFNRYTFIDITKVEGDIDELWEEIEAIAKSLTIVPLESDTIQMFSEKTPDGTLVSGDVKIAESQVFSGVITPNIILPTEDGIYTYVDLTYDKPTDTLIFQVNGDKKEVEIDNNYVVSGMYSVEDESILLKMKKGDDVVIDVHKLINEWTVEGDASKTPIVLTRERVKYSGDPEQWQDVLRADVRLVEGEDNILETHNNGEALYVKGVASNIKYKNNIDSSITNVKEGLDKAIELSQTGISSDIRNIIFEKQDGIFASAKLTYTPTENKLTFTTSNVNGGETTTDINLVGVELFTDVDYDKETESLIIKYKDNTGTEKTVIIPLGDLVDEWEPDNHDHTVTITKVRVIDGKDKVSADVNLSDKSDNILVKDGSEDLYVKGTADNIKYANGVTVKDKIDEFGTSIAAISSETTANTEAIAAEVARATAAESAISGKVDENAAAIHAEQDRATAAETAISGLATSNKQVIDILGGRVSGLETDLRAEITRASDAEEALSDEILAERVRATSAETAIKSDVDDVKEDVAGIESDVTRLESDLQAEITRASDAEQTNATAIANETTRATSAETAISGAVASNKQDIDTLKSNVSGLQTDLNAEVSRATAAEQANATAIANETTRATSAETALSGAIVTNKQDIDTLKTNVNTLQSDLQAEVNRATAAEQTNATAIANEAVRATSAETALSGAIATNKLDIATLKNNVSGLQTDLQSEVSRAQAAEQTLAYDIHAEQDRASVAETAISAVVATNKQTIDVLGSGLTNLQTSLQNEVSRATSAEQANATAIADETTRATSAETEIKTAANALSEKVNTLSGKIDTEISARTADIATLDGEIDVLTDRLAAEETRSREADLAISGEVTVAKSDIVTLKSNVANNISAITALQSGLTAEATRATSAETTIQNELNAEVTRSVAKDEELEAKVSAATLTFDETTTIRLNKDTNNNVTGVLKIANAESNMVVIDNSNHGVYANVDLIYDSGTNKLTFKTTSQGGVVTKDLQLNGGSLIDSIEYDAEHKNLVIKYTDQHGAMHTVTLGVEELFNDFEVVNPATNSAVELTKTPGASGQPAQLSARVIFSGLESNIARFDSNGIYVDGTQISANTEAISGLQTDVATIKDQIIELSGDTSKIEILSAQVQGHESRLQSIESTITGMNNRMDNIESEFAGMKANISANTVAIANEQARAMAAESQIRIDLQTQITQNKLKVYPGDNSIVLTEDTTGNGTYVKLGQLDAGYL